MWWLRRLSPAGAGLLAVPATHAEPNRPADGAHNPFPASAAAVCPTLLDGPCGPDRSEWTPTATPIGHRGRCGRPTCRCDAGADEWAMFAQALKRADSRSDGARSHVEPSHSGLVPGRGLAGGGPRSIFRAGEPRHVVPGGWSPPLEAPPTVPIAPIPHRSPFLGNVPRRSPRPSPSFRVGDRGGERSWSRFSPERFGRGPGDAAGRCRPLGRSSDDAVDRP